MASKIIRVKIEKNCYASFSMGVKTTYIIFSTESAFCPLPLIHCSLKKYLQGAVEMIHSVKCFPEPT